MESGENSDSNSQTEIENISKDERSVFRKSADFVNKLPFAGKFATSSLTLDAIHERNPYYKNVKTAEAVGFLGVMVAAHSSLTGLGLSRLQSNAEQLAYNHSPENLLACGIDVAYTAANCAATYAQLHLAGRLGKHLSRKDVTSVPRLKGWGIDGEQVNYNLVAENLMTAIVNGDQRDIDTFFMVLPKEEKQKVMENINAITEIADETYSYDVIDKKISQLDEDVEAKSRFGYLLNIVKNAHKNRYGKPYSAKEVIATLTTTIAGQIGFLKLG